jgi:hypothetical protein
LASLSKSEGQTGAIAPSLDTSCTNRPIVLLTKYRGEKWYPTLPPGRDDEPARRMLARCVHAPPPLQGMFGIVHLNRRDIDRRGGPSAWDRLGLNEVGTVAGRCAR